jgi:hypothetical protein
LEAKKKRKERKKEGRKKGRKEKRKEGRKEGKEGGREGEGRKEGKEEGGQKEKRETGEANARYFLKYMKRNLKIALQSKMPTLPIIPLIYIGISLFKKKNSCFLLALNS